MIYALLLCSAMAGPNASRDVGGFFEDVGDAFESAGRDINDHVLAPTGDAFESLGRDINEHVLQPTGDAFENLGRDIEKLWDEDVVPFFEHTIAEEVKCWLLNFITEKLVAGLGCAAIVPLAGAAATVAFGNPAAGGVASAISGGLCFWANNELNSGSTREDVRRKANC